mgnify:CR=1 FL=1
MKIKLEELVKNANNLLNKEQKYKDQRISNELTIRRVRDYITKGILDSGIKEGRETFYTEEHLNQLIEIRKLQSKGISDKLLVNFSSSYQDINTNVNNKNNEDDLNSLLSGIESRNDDNSSFTRSIYTNSLSKSNLYSSTSNLMKENFKVDSYEEYPLDKDKTIFLKIKIGTNIEEIDSSIEKAKKILKQKKEDEND